MKTTSTHQKAVWIAEKLNNILKLSDPDRIGREISSTTIKTKATPEEINYWFYTLRGGKNNG